MALRARYLADKSAWEWGDAVPERWQPLVSEGLIATCSIVELEVLYSARSSQNWVTLRAQRSALELIKLKQSTVDRAIEVQGLLSQQTELGHRSANLPDLLVAACAEEVGLTVMHYDQDFDRIAEVTGQSCEWLAPRGTLMR